MFKSFSQISEQAYLIDYGDTIDVETNNKVINHFKYIQNLNYRFILNIVPSFNKLLILFDTRYKKDTLNLIGWQTLDIYQNLNITYLNFKHSH